MYEKIHSATDDIIEEYIRISGKYGLNISMQDFILLRQQAVKESNGILSGDNSHMAVQTPSQTSQKATEKEIESPVKDSPKKAKRTPKKAETVSAVLNPAQNDGENRTYQAGVVGHENPASMAQQTAVQSPSPNERLDPMAVLSRRKDALNM